MKTGYMVSGNAKKKTYSIKINHSIMFIDISIYEFWPHGGIPKASESNWE